MSVSSSRGAISALLGQDKVIAHVQALVHTCPSRSRWQVRRAGVRGPRADWYVWAEPLADACRPDNGFPVFRGAAGLGAAAPTILISTPFLRDPKLNLRNPHHCGPSRLRRSWLARGATGSFDAVDFFLQDEHCAQSGASDRRGASSVTISAHLSIWNSPSRVLERMAFNDRYPGVMRSPGRQRDDHIASWSASDDIAGAIAVFTPATACQMNRRDAARSARITE